MRTQDTQNSGSFASGGGGCGYFSSHYDDRGGAHSRKRVVMGDVCHGITIDAEKDSSRGERSG